MANYKPLASFISATLALSGRAVNKDVSQTSWKLMLLEGSAKFSDTIVPSAAVNVYQTVTASGHTPDHTTFTNAKGYYGVTVTAHVPLVIKVYSK